MEKFLIINYNEIVFPTSEKELGNGSFGRVLQATFQNKPVAVKVLFAKHKKEVIEKESKMLTKCRHKNIVEYFGVFYDERNGIVLELMEGGSLYDILHEYKYVQYSYCHIFVWCQQILDALEYLHQNNVIHRDLKPLNILMTNEFFTSKLSDFGTVREIDESMSSFIGTMVYMAPEIITHKYDYTCDIYSFGVILWEMLARELPGLNKNALYNKIASHRQELQALIKRCWSDDRNKRSTISEIRSIVKKLCCNHCQNSCFPLLDSLTNQPALASQLTKQTNETMHLFLPTKIDHSPIQNKQYSKMLIHACEDGNFQVIKLLLRKGANINSKNKDNNGWTPLHSACQNKKYEMVKFLLENGAKIGVKDNDGWAALHLTCRFGHFKFAKLLLKNNVNINVKNNGNVIPRYTAGYTENLKIVRLLLENGADIDVKNNDGETLLHIACNYDCLEVVEFLLENGANINAVNEDNRTPLHLACKMKNFEVIEFLLNNGANINALTNDNITSLHIACGNIELVKFLISKDPSIINLKDKDNVTPLHIACMDSNLEIVKFLLKKGVNIDALTKDNMTPLHFACIDGDFEVIKFLLENGANINALDNHNHTPFHCACQFGDFEVVKILMKNGADINTVDNDGDNSLHHACQNRHLEIVKLLSNKGFKINAVNNDRWTPLHWACHKGYFEIAKFLVENGANINAKDMNRKTPWDLAVEAGFGDEFNEFKTDTCTITRL